MVGQDHPKIFEAVVPVLNRHRTYGTNGKIRSLDNSAFGNPRDKDI